MLTAVAAGGGGSTCLCLSLSLCSGVTWKKATDGVRRFCSSPSPGTPAPPVCLEHALKAAQSEGQEPGEHGGHAQPATPQGSTAYRKGLPSVLIPAATRTLCCPLAEEKGEATCESLFLE
ncbi:hypothetical protein DPEC_G00305820 [Dallia pectoralis]|uniref:Uncharacterized protein n=1 Tax=Dallia pectoralis TaxID=75939 RepID=A0ACC2FDX8_DALPE|nr:hypothetical protein DPEC_G00305820 [Dallia pectoralis]